MIAEKTALKSMSVKFLNRLSENCLREIDCPVHAVDNAYPND